MTGSIRNFEKLNFTPKSSVFCFSQGQTSEYDRLAHSQLVPSGATGFPLASNTIFQKIDHSAENRKQFAIALPVAQFKKS